MTNLQELKLRAFQNEEVRSEYDKIKGVKMSELLRCIEWDKTAGNSPAQTQDLNDPYVKLSIDLVKEEVNGEGELLDSYDKGNLKGVIDGIADVFKVLAQLCFSLDIDPELLIKEVNDSNFSKFCTTKEQALESVYSYNDDDRYEGVFAELVGDYYIIKGWKVGQNHFADKPKILKAYDYVEFDAEKFIK